MAALVFLVVFGGVFYLFAKVMNRGAMRTSIGLGGGRVIARGLVLSASPYSGGERTQNGQRYELRDLVLDVEIPGRDPYEVSVTPLIPRIVEARPGATLDLAVNPRRPSDITVIGPAGSHAWLGAASQLSIPQLAGLGSGGKVGRYLNAALFACLPAFFAAGFVAHLRSSSTPPASHAAAPPATHAAQAQCEAAAKCCRVIGGGGCAQLATLPSAGCAAALQAEQVAAGKLHKRCP